jgi:predicted DNA-binding antitoxin AbrB/MazE fold protein
MAKTVEAIFENGVFKPKESPNIPEHKRVTLIIEELHEESYNILSLASKVYSDLSPEDIEDIEKMATDRNNFSRNSN